MSFPAEPASDGHVTLVPTDSVSASDEVRHFDQLSSRARSAVIAADRGQVSLVSAPSLAGVDVVVFTDYYRIE